MNAPISKTHILPDRLAPDLPIWFVGTAAGPKSAAVGAYYAHPGNRFWRALFEAGITPRIFTPQEFPLLLDLGVGLTDFCKTDWGVDAQIDRRQFDRPAFVEKINTLRPRALAFTSKTSASLWLQKPTGQLTLGQQKATDASAPIAFVLPSPSGLATSYWSLDPWRDVGDWLRANRSRTKR